MMNCYMQNKSVRFEKMIAGQWYNAMDYSMLKLRQEKSQMADDI